MVGAFQHPANGTFVLMLKMLQEPLVEAVAIEMAYLGEPVSIAGDRVGGIKPRAYEDVCSDFRTLLRGSRVDWVHALEFRRQQPEHLELSGYLLPPTVRSTTEPPGRIRMDHLPDPRRQIGFVCH